jgi:hypothetical protein
MSPTLAVRDSTYLRLLDPELVRDLLLGTLPQLQQHDDRSHVGLSELCVVISLAPLAMFFPTVPNTTITVVLRLRTDIQMRRIDTRSVIAVMKNVQPFRDRAVMDFPRQSVRPPPSAWIGTAIHEAIAVLQSTKPFPAFIVCTPMDFHPETFVSCRHEYRLSYLPPSPTLPIQSTPGRLARCRSRR